MICELDSVVLFRDIDKHNLKCGDIGAVVHCYEGGTAYEVEFVTAAGETVAILTLTQDDIRAMDQKEILHVREFASV